MQMRLNGVKHHSVLVRWRLRLIEMASRAIDDGTGVLQRTRPKLLKRGESGRSARADRELALSDPMGEFHASECDSRRAKGLEGQHWCTATLDCSMVLLDDVIEIPTAANRNGFPLRVLLPQQI